MHRKQVVISVHGIRTRGVWQKQLAPVLARHDFVPHLVDYNNFGAIAFLIPFLRRRKLRRLRKELTDIMGREGVSRPSVIAHSFGALLVCEFLREHPEAKFDKVILVGSIAPKAFPWGVYLDGDKVLCVRNEVGRRDPWPAVANWLVLEAGNSGRLGFIDKHPKLEQPRYDVDHSGTFYVDHYEEWCRFLRRPTISLADRKYLREILEIAVMNTAQHLGLPTSDVRANIFLPDGEHLAIPEGCHFNMDWDEGKPIEQREVSMQIRSEWGCTGTAYTTRIPLLGLSEDGDWRDYRLPEAELAKAHPNLKWIMSWPLTESARGTILGVMNIDGLAASASLESPDGAAALYNEAERCAKALSKLVCAVEQGSMC